MEHNIFACLASFSSKDGRSMRREYCFPTKFIKGKTSRQNKKSIENNEWQTELQIVLPEGTKRKENTLDVHQVQYFPLPAN